jgi:hypothetical protein
MDMNDPNTPRPPGGPPGRPRLALVDVSDGSNPSLPPRLVRSAAPGYVLVAVASLAISIPITWTLARQTEAIDEAESRAAATVQLAAPPASASAVAPVEPAVAPASTAPPVEPPNQEVSRLTTTGALVPAPPTQAAPPAREEPPQPVDKLPQRADKRSQPAHKKHASPAVPRDDDNPYDAPSLE